MNLFDLLLTPLYLVILYSIAYYVRSKISNPLVKKYFISGLTLKFVGAIALGIVYHFYYSGGDTNNYYNNGTLIYNAFLEDFLIGVKLLFLNSGEFTPDTFPHTSRIWGFSNEANFFVIKLSGFFGLFCFNTYTIIALLFATFSFSGIFALYRTFVSMNPRLNKEFAIACFFVPSCFFWGSGLMKDSITIGALGWAFFAFYHAFILKKKIIKSLIILTFSLIVIQTVKTYILLCFIPSAVLWVFMENSYRIKNAFIKMLATPIFITIGLIIGYYGGTTLTADSKRYALENVAATASTTSNYLERQTLRKIGTSRNRTGSSYSVGKLDGSLRSMIVATPQAIFVSLFRPFIFEVKNPVMLLSAIESTWFLLFTLYIILKTGIMKIFLKITQQPMIVFCLIFTLIFALGVGLTSGNFGTLVRYKIPLIPFYIAALYLLKNDYRYTNNVVTTN